ncbi:MAG: hypothetical protein AAGK78_14465, partial [Planctomycetota bacterium]
MDDNAPTRRVSTTPARYREVVWSPDGGTLYFTSDETGRDAIYAATVEMTRGEIKKALEPEEVEEADDADAEASGAATEPTTKPTTAPSTAPASQPAEEEEEEALAWAPDPKKWSDAIRFRVETVSASDAGDHMPMPSPDGTKLAFNRGVGDLLVLDLETGEETLVFNGWIDVRPLWYPDSQHIFYQAEDADFNNDVWATSIAGDMEPVNLTRHPDDEFSASISADGRLLAFTSERVGEEYDVWMVHLDEELETLTPGELAQYYKDAAAAVKKAKPIAVPDFAKMRGTVSPLVEDPEPEAEEVDEDPATQPATAPATQPEADAEASGDDDEEKKDDKKKSGIDAAPFEDLAL